MNFKTSEVFEIAQIVQFKVEQLSRESDTFFIFTSRLIFDYRFQIVLYDPASRETEKFFKKIK